MACNQSKIADHLGLKKRWTGKKEGGNKVTGVVKYGNLKNQHVSSD